MSRATSRHATINGHAPSCSRDLINARPVTPARLGALGISIAVLIVAVWLVFVGLPAGPAPQPSNVAVKPSSSASGTPAPAGSASSSPGASSSMGAPASAEPSPGNPLLKQPAAHSVDPDQLTGYHWPVKLGLITTRFAPLAPTDGGFVTIDGIPYHDGLDLATRCGDRVRASHDGTVLYAGRDYDPFLGYQGDAGAVYDRLERLGRTSQQPIVVVIDDGNGYRSVYVHLKEANVEAGQAVKSGDQIGVEGATGFASGCHVHYSLIRMDGVWQPVVSRLLQYGYPPRVRERVNPLDVLPWGDPDAPQRLQDKVNPPSPTPIPSGEPSAQPSTSPEASEPAASSSPSSKPTS